MRDGTSFVQDMVSRSARQWTAIVVVNLGMQTTGYRGALIVDGSRLAEKVQEGFLKTVKEGWEHIEKLCRTRGRKEWFR